MSSRVFLITDLKAARIPMAISHRDLAEDLEQLLELERVLT